MKLTNNQKELLFCFTIPILFTVAVIYLSY